MYDNAGSEDSCLKLLISAAFLSLVSVSPTEPAAMKMMHVGITVCF